MLETQEHREYEATIQQSRLSASKNQRQYQNAVEESIVLEVNVIDDEQSWRQKN